MVLLKTSSADTDPAPRKFWKLETRDSLAVAEAASTGAREEQNGHDSVSVRVTVKRGRLVLLAAVAVTTVVALTLAFSGGVVIETFERQAVSIQKQEKMVEKYNSYSGTVTAAIERPLELFMALVVHVAVLRLLANDVLDTEKRWRIRVLVVALSAGATYLLANGLSAVNVQSREQPVRLVVTANDLAAESPDLTMSSTVGVSFSENQPGNPVTNTILRNLVVPQAVEKQQDCGNMNVMVGQDEVLYRTPSQPWQKHLVPTALEHRSMQFEVAASNTAANVALTPDQFPMNASVAADLLLYTTRDPSKGSAWACRNSLLGDALAKRFFLEANQSIPMPPPSISDVPSARLTQLLPPSLGTTEREDREWFLKKVAPIMYSTANESYKNASLRSWNMTFSHVDIEPETLWVDAVTIEREMATPRLGTNATSNSSTRYLAIDPTMRMVSASKFILKAGGASDEGIELYCVCADNHGDEKIISDCFNRSVSSFVVVSGGKRLVADAVIENATIESSKLVLGKGDGVIVNMREIFSVTVARISWRLQNLSAVYNAKCEDIGGCMGLDVALPGSGQRLLVSASMLPLDAAPPMFTGPIEFYETYSLVSVRRPESFYVQTGNGFIEHATFAGDVLMAHNIRNGTATHLAGQTQVSDRCLSKPEIRLARYMNNHIYMESTLQPAYMAATFILLQGGVAHDILNQSWTTQRMLRFDGNKQSVNVVVVIPRLNVILTLSGCLVLVVVIAFVLLWPLLKKESDPLAHITTPHTVAKILLNETAFPPLLLTRSVAPSEDKVSGDNADDFFLESLSLTQKKTRDGGEDDNTLNGDAGQPTKRINIAP
jgi:hypothetical protein